MLRVVSLASDQQGEFRITTVVALKRGVKEIDVWIKRGISSYR